MDLTYFADVEGCKRLLADRMAQIRFALTHDEGERVMAGVQAAMVSQGLKLFKVSYDLFDSLKDVELRLPCADFKLPFDVIAIEYKPWHHVAIMRLPDRVACLVYMPGRVVHWYSLLFDDARFTSVEAALNEPGPHELDGVVRAAMNCCVLFTHLGVRKQGWLDEKERRRHERSGRFLDRDIEVYETEQNLGLWGRENLSSPSPPQGGGGWTVTPHWRRAHWSSVACGKGRTQRKLVFKKAAFINKDLFKGEMADTRVTVS